MTGSSFRALVRLPLDFFFTEPTTPWMPLVVHAPLLVGPLVWNLLGGTPLGLVIALPLAGVLLWTLLEYLIHGFAFHRSYRWAVLHRLLYQPHGEHHDDPTNPKHFFARPTFTFPVAGLLWGLFRLALPSWQLAALPVAGLTAGYLAYELIHYAIHTVPTAGLIRPLVSHHLHHHYADPQRCFGVTSPLWDIVFRTGRRPRSSQLRVVSCQRRQTDN